jgi:mannose-6-phosphate isomerase-like protein (cupin superfamily)
MVRLIACFPEDLMHSHVSKSSAVPAAVAPDGIAIHAFDLFGAAFVGIVEGRIPRGRYGIHRHLSLEQFTYVLSGRLTVITGDDGHAEGQSRVLDAGDLLLTLPGESLQFLNDSDEEARTLFICAPPYPPDDSDTRMVARHGGPESTFASDAIQRLETARTTFNRVIDERIARSAEACPDS